MDDGRCVVELAGEQVHLLAERALWWPKRRTILVADVHLGRIASFRARGAPVPGDTLGETLDRLGRVVERSSADRLVVLGDLVQEREGLTDGLVRRVAEAMASWDVRVGLVPGNHERKVGRLPAEWPLEVIEPGARMGPFRLHHLPSKERRGEANRDGFELAGHFHPTVRLESGGDKLRLPCFAFDEQAGVLPAFHTMTNGVEMRAGNRRLFLVADGEVIALTRESKMVMSNGAEDVDG